MSEDKAVEPKGATGAGRGVLYISFAKFYFMLAGMIVQFRLPAILTRSAFGSYNVLASVTSFVNNVLVTGTIQAVSRFSAQNPGNERAVQHAGLRMHVRLGLPVAVVFVAAAPLVSHFVLFDESKTAPLMLAGLIVGGNSFYAVFVGTANGMHQFHKQAGLDITFATIRSIGLLGMAMAGLGVIGVIGGWAAAVGIILCASAIWVGMPKQGGVEKLPVKPLLQYFASVALYLTLFNALMFADGILIKRITTVYFQDHAKELAASLGHMPWAQAVTGYRADPSVLADVQVAYYAAVQNVARLSYQAIIAVTFVVFPLVSRSTFTEDNETTKRYIRVTARYSLIFAMAIAVVMAANPADVLGLIYAPDYVEKGTAAVLPLAFGNVAFSVIAINGTILNSAGYTRAAIVIAATTLAIAIIGNMIAIPMAVDDGLVLPVAATVTAGAMLFGALASGAVLYKKLGAFLPLASIVRIAIATGAALVVGRFLPLHGKLMTLVEACIVGLTFLVTLVATRELGKRDLDAIKAVRKKRATGGDPP
ncbi:MAG: oligosaccharide flippase family protein [Myxococcota bacterium]|nr:polysaccharide biosynthesis protein [Deltaproteobacteria bacterium]MDQ3336890.1 oligosaccharide flippase family protein [Myxococcota bacterium]